MKAIANAITQRDRGRDPVAVGVPEGLFHGPDPASLRPPDDEGRAPRRARNAGRARAPVGAVRRSGRLAEGDGLLPRARARGHRRRRRSPTCARRCAALLSRELGREVDVETMMAAIRFRAYPDAAPALAALRERGLTLVCVSNWDYALPRGARRCGLADSLDGVVTSADGRRSQARPGDLRARRSSSPAASRPRRCTSATRGRGRRRGARGGDPGAAHRSRRWRRAASLARRDRGASPTLTEPLDPPTSQPPPADRAPPLSRRPDRPPLRGRRSARAGRSGAAADRRAGAPGARSAGSASWSSPRSGWRSRS